MREDTLETADCEFTPTVPPQADFLIAWSPREATLAELPGTADFASLKAGRHIRLYTNASGISALEQNETFLVGSVKVDERIVLGPKILSSGIFGRQPLGQCTLIERNDTGLSVRSDYFGMCPLFYFESGSLSLLSNRFHLICVALRRAGRLEMDINAWRTMFYTNDAFSYQLATLQTPARGVRMSLHTMSFQLSDGRGIEIENAPTEQVTDVLTPCEYRALIRQAAEEIASNLDAALRSFPDENIAMQITGGRDSRVNLAALLSLGKLNAVAFRTAKRGRDVEIAGKLIRHFGGRYRMPDESPPCDVIAVPFPSLMAQRRSKFFGLYHHVDLRKSTCQIFDRKLITIVGGCGELYRSFYQKKNAFSHLDMNRFGDAEEVKRFVKHCGHWRKLFDRDEYVGAEDEIVESFLNFRSGTVDHLLNEHYRQIRSRAHFGIAKMNFTESNLTWMPLMSPALLNASMGLPFEERNSGRVVFDVTKALCEELAYLPYESPNPDFARSPYHGASVFDDRTPCFKTTSPAGAVRRLAGRASPRKAPSRPRNLPSAESKIDYMTRNATHALRSLIETHSVLGGRSQREIANKLDYIARSKPQSIQYLYSKLSGLRDLVRLSG